MPGQINKWFRKHRKALLAILTLMAMLSFVFIPVVLQLLDVRGGGKNALVVSTSKYGSLYEVDLDNLVRQRHLVYGFLQNVRQAVAEKRGRGEAVQMALYEMGQDPASERAVVEAWLLARRAEGLGLRVTDEAINAFVQSVTDGKVSAKEVNKVLAGFHASEGGFFGALGRELLAMRVRQMFRKSLEGIPPEQRYDYFLRMNRNAKIEAIPVAVEKYVDQVQAPSYEELQALFEQYKEKLYDPDSPEPGFRQPHTIDLQYLRAELESFVDLKAVSDEAVSKYYNENKERLYREKAPPVSAPQGAAPKVEPSTPELPKLEPPKPGAAKAELPKAVAPAGEPPKPGAAKAELLKAAAPAGEPAKVKPGDKGDRKTSSARGDSQFRLVSFAEKESAAAPAAKAGPALAAPAPAAPGKAEPPAAKADPSSPKAQPAASKVEATTKAGAAKSEPAAPGKASEAKKAEPNYVPLEKVRDEIRRHLAEQQAQAKMQKVLAVLQDRMLRHQRERMAYNEADEASKQTLAPPAPLDLAALAKRNGLKSVETGWISEHQAQKLDIGASSVDRKPFVQYAFGPLVEHQPVMSQDLEGNRCLFWKVGDDLEKVPEWSDSGVREQVLHAWKFLGARDLAAQEAERLAELARKSPKSPRTLKDVSGSLVTPDPFTWMTDRSVWLGNPRPQISAVRGVDRPGMDFMQSVFRLSPGGVGLAWNYPKSVVYVVLLVEHTPPDSDLWTRFVTTPGDLYMMAAAYDWDTMQTLWKQEIETEVNLRWHRPPHQERGVRE
jgi:hypothetical protein